MTKKSSKKTGKRRRSGGKRTAAKRRGKASSRKRGRFRSLRIALVVGLAAAGAWTLWPFWHLSLSFDQRAVTAPSRVFARPLWLVEGRNLSTGELEGELTALGYRRRPERRPDPGEYHREGGRYTIYLRAYPTESGERKPSLVTVALAAGRIASLSEEGRPVRSAHLEPPLLATLMGPDRTERRPVALDALPEDLVHAVLAAEDSGFFSHPGLSVRGILRAAWSNVVGEGPLQGGSTLTQQLVKNLYLTQERTLARKLREAVLAIVLEQRYDKHDILEAYLNEIYWGRSGGVNLAGVGAAARAYFGKDAAYLDLAESALLAGMIQAPNRYEPSRHPELARQRRDSVLERMHELGWIDAQALEAARSEPLDLRPSPVVVRRAPYFVDRALAEVGARFGVDPSTRGGLAVLTTLSWRDQQAAEGAVAWGLGALEQGWEKQRGPKGELEAALVSIDPGSGEILAGGGGPTTRPASSIALRRRSARREAPSSRWSTRRRSSREW